ncbi:MAG: hypothetical protein PHP53_22195 [Prolixibacteraceae bacterium]|jgi:hypothetical protein|nr:hypothetical protein [Prolixibacteraceae bacterium]
MNYIRHLNGFFARLAEDKRMSSYHISLYFALFQQWNADRFGEQFVITRTETMYMSRLGSVNTYARCMKELSLWGYIQYIPSSNIHSGSRVSCIRFDTASDTANSTGTDTGIENDTAGDTGTDTGRNTGTSCNLINDTATDTARNTGIKNDTAGNTGTDTASDTGISSDLKSDTGRNTAGDKIGGAGIKNDTAWNTATDTPFINSLNKNKQEEESVRRNQKFEIDENEKKQKRFRTTNSKNLPDEKSQVPDLSETEQFFEQNQFPRSEAQKFYAHYQSSGWKTGDQMKILSWQAVARKWMNNTQSFKPDEREPNQVGTSKLSVTVNKDYSEPL